MARFNIPQKVAENLEREPAGRSWLEQLPGRLTEISRRWALTVEQPFTQEATCSWVAPCTRSNGSKAVLKVGFPHMEAAQEIDGLTCWSGDPTVFLLAADRDLNAMLLERCDPGTPLRVLPEEAQDVVIAGLLKRLWREPGPSDRFRSLTLMIESWCDAARQKSELWADRSLAEDGLRVFEVLDRDAADSVLLATDLHAGNVLKARRKPWLAIDPKPFVGDRAYDVTQHLLNCRDRLTADPLGTIKRMANLADVDCSRVRLWTFARLAIQTQASGGAQALARRLR